MDSKASEWTALAKVYNPLTAGSIDGTDDDPHDRGIVRAMTAKYRPNKNVIGDPAYTVFVARLSPKTTESDLREIFKKWGEIRRLRLVRDIVTGFSKGYAFVEYEEQHSAKEACRHAHQLFVDGNELFVDFECERTLKGWVPRRLGGGFGGKKEAGQLRFGGIDRPHKKPILISMKSRADKDLDASRWLSQDSKRGNDRDSYSHKGHRRHSRRSRSRSVDKHKRSRSRSRSRSRHSTSVRRR